MKKSTVGPVLMASLLVASVLGVTIPCGATDPLDALIKKYQDQNPPAAEVVAPKVRKASRTPAAAKTVEKLTIPPSEKTPVLAEKAAPELTEDSLFGSWYGLKDKLGDKGISIELGYKHDTVSTLSGGLDSDTFSLGNVDLITEWDLEKLLGAQGYKLHLYGLGNHGDAPTDIVGDSFSTSNIQAPEAFKLYQAYLSKNIDDRFSVALGVQDLNSQFYASDTPGVFINSAFGISPSVSQTGLNGPSIFPVAALALVFNYDSPSQFYFRSGVFNAQAGDPDQTRGTHFTNKTDEGYLYIWEIGHDKGEASTFKYGVGGWHYTKDADAIDGSASASRNWGLYLILDKNINDKFSVFARHGMSAERVNMFASATEVGATYLGLIKPRPNDTLGLGVATSTISQGYVSANDSTKSETAFELLYRFQFGHGIAVTPDLQVIANPGAVKGADTATVGTLRIELKF